MPRLKTLPLVSLTDIERLPGDFIPVNTAAQYLRCGPQALRLQARKDPPSLGFPVTILGPRVLIPKKPFISYIIGGDLSK